MPPACRRSPASRSSPDKFVFTGKDKQKPLQVIAKYSDGTTRVVNNLALYLTNNKSTADIDDQGVVTPGKRGDTSCLRASPSTPSARRSSCCRQANSSGPRSLEINYIDR